MKQAWELFIVLAAIFVCTVIAIDLDFARLTASSNP